MLRRTLPGVGLCLVIILILSGCGGPPPAPTETTELHDAGTQIVDDSSTLFTRFSESYDSGGIGEIADDVGYNVERGFNDTGEMVFHHVNYGLLAFSSSLFYLTPGSYTYNEANGMFYDGSGSTAVPQTERQTGTWYIDVIYDDGLGCTEDYWDCEFTRSISGGQDTLTYTLNNIDYVPYSDLIHTGTVSYPTFFLDGDLSGDSSSSCQFSTTMTELGNPSAVVFDMELAGDLDLFVAEERINLTNVALTFGWLDPTLGPYSASFTGELLINHYTTPSASPDRLQGILTTPTTTIEGLIELYWTENTYFDPTPDPIFDYHVPYKLVVSGAIYKTAGYPRLDGSLTLEIQNPAGDPADYYMGDTGEVMNFKATLAGSIATDADNIFAAEICLEEVALHVYRVSADYELTSGGVYRQIQLTVENLDENTLHVAIDSDFGPATLDVTAAFAGGIVHDLNEDLPPTALTGTVTVGANIEGDITMDETGLKITYENNTYETFAF